MRHADTNDPNLFYVFNAKWSVQCPLKIIEKDFIFFLNFIKKEFFFFVLWKNGRRKKNVFNGAVI